MEDDGAEFPGWEVIRLDLSEQPDNLEVDSGELALNYDYFSVSPGLQNPALEPESVLANEGSGDRSWIEPGEENVSQGSGDEPVNQSNVASDCVEDAGIEGGDRPADREEEKGGELEFGGDPMEAISNVEKMPFVWWNLMKFYVFKVKPGWTISIAAAIFGAVILGRRFYYRWMRKNARIQLKVSIDDKATATYMAQAAHVNQVFSPARRLPTIIPSLPGGSVLPWPVVVFTLS